MFVTVCHVIPFTRPRAPRHTTKTRCVTMRHDINVLRVQQRQQRHTRRCRQPVHAMFVVQRLQALRRGADVAVDLNGTSRQTHENHTQDMMRDITNA